ncbi:hypothetical protein BDA96_02G225100 [Sorghum bicolor]|uniref:Uncharacterized protein n=2 Tax=Sorghum bicolor TaxID=4558 RepID=A0A921RQ63_SORBI|nr:hypothetical protein BDA96_02G225100 [Sorghum bicolor]KXG36228.1 hypothetical protein SORBI_3002G303400 [Sorghum bicolor]
MPPPRRPSYAAREGSLSQQLSPPPAISSSSHVLDWIKGTTQHLIGSRAPRSSRSRRSRGRPCARELMR